MGANACVNDTRMDHIIVQEDVRLIEIWEEFLHGTQYRAKVIKKRGLHAAEVHVKRFMIRHRRLLRLEAGDVRVLEQLLGEG